VQNKKILKICMILFCVLIQVLKHFDAHNCDVSIGIFSVKKFNFSCYASGSNLIKLFNFDNISIMNICRNSMILSISICFVRFYESTCILRIVVII